MFACKRSGIFPINRYPNPDAPAPSAGKPRLWLGAKSPFGLALPSAQPSAGTMYAPRGVWLDDERLVVCDSGNHRVLIWHSVPTTDQAAADIVLGQPDFQTEGPAANGRGPENGFHLPTGEIVADGKLLVADAWHHRVLFWNQVPSRSDTPPDYALGQSNLLEIETNRGRSPSLQGMNWPYGIAWIRGRLLVADTGNRRVLIWDSIPPDPINPRTMVLGQTDASNSDKKIVVDPLPPIHSVGLMILPGPAKICSSQTRATTGFWAGIHFPRPISPRIP